MKRIWLAAVAMLAGMTVPADAVRTRVAAKAKQVRPVQVVARLRPPPSIIGQTSAVAPEPVADYRWLDDADAAMTAIGDGAPQLAFADEGAMRYAWQLADGTLVVAEPMTPGDTRYYFFDADMTAPFLVRDRLYSFGFDRGRLAAVYDDRGEPMRWAPDDWRERAAADLYARGRRLWFAARTPQRAEPHRGTVFPIVVNIGADRARWRDDDGRRHRRGERGYGDDRRDRRGPGWAGSSPAFGNVAPRPSKDGPGRRERQAGQAPFDGLPPTAATAPVAFAPPSEPTGPTPDRPDAGSPRRQRGEQARAGLVASTGNDAPRPGLDATVDAPPAVPPTPDAAPAAPDAAPAVPAPDAAVPAPREAAPETSATAPHEPEVTAGAPREEPRSSVEETAPRERVREERRPTADRETVERPD